MYRDFGSAMWLSGTAALTSFMNFLPSLIGAMIILIAGWYVSALLARLLEKGMRAIGFENASERAGVNDFLRRSGSMWSTSMTVAEIVKWFLRLICLQAAANLLAMPQLTILLNSIVLFIPNLVLTVVIIVVGMMIAKFVGGVVRGSLSEMGFTNAELLARLTCLAITAFVIVAAIDQLGIARTIITTMFSGVVFAISLALGLAFGLGGKETAAKIAASWYTHGQTIASHAAAKAQEQTNYEPEVQERFEQAMANDQVRPLPDVMPVVPNTQPAASSPVQAPIPLPAPDAAQMIRRTPLAIQATQPSETMALPAVISSMNPTSLPAVVSSGRAGNQSQAETATETNRKTLFGWLRKRAG